MRTNDQQLSVEQRLLVAERKLRVMWILCLLELGLVAVGVTIAFHAPRAAAQAPAGEIIHARGLVIQDAQGRPRILLGAPFPQVPERTRKDGQTAAILFLGENGADRLSLGETPNLPNQDRIAQAVGVGIYDPTGRERGGFGFIGDTRAMFALDRASGDDAVGAMVDDKSDFAGFMMNYPRATGNPYPTGIEIGIQSREAFLRLKQCCSEKNRAVLSVAPDGTPSLRTYDAQGKEQINVFQAPSPK